MSGSVGGTSTPEEIQLNPVLAEIFRTGKAQDLRGAERQVFPSGVSTEEAQLLYRLAREAGDGTTLETGLGFGISALAMLQAHADNNAGKHITIDPLQRSHVGLAGVTSIRRAGYAAFHKHFEEPSHSALPYLASANTRLKLAFIDGCHRFEHILLDMMYVDRMLDPGGYLAFHDARMPATRKVLSYLLRWRADDYEPLAPGMQPMGLSGQFGNTLFLWKQHPFELPLVRTLSRWRTENLVVLKKRTAVSFSDLGGTPDFYRPF